MRPLIGISTYREQARWGTWHVPAVLLPISGLIRGLLVTIPAPACRP